MALSFFVEDFMDYKTSSHIARIAMQVRVCGYFKISEICEKSLLQNIEAIIIMVSLAK